MLAPRVPWWMYVMTFVFTFTYSLNLWHDVMGPEGFGYRRAGLRIGDVFPNRPFSNAGAQTGDILIAINGEPLESPVDRNIAETRIGLRQPFTIDVQRGVQRLRLSGVLERRSIALWDWRGYVRVGSLQAARLICLLLAIVIAFKKPDDLAARLGALLLAAVTITAPPSPGQVPLVTSLPLPLEIVAAFSLAVFPMLVPTVWFCFFASFPRRRLIRPWHWFVAVLPGVLVDLPLAIVRAAKAASWTSQSVSIEAYILVGLVITAQQFAGMGILVVNYRSAQDRNEQRKLRVLLLGTALGWIGAIIVIIGLNQRDIAGTMPAVIGPILFLFFPLSFAYAILRHRLFDVSVVVRRGIQYALARGVVIAALPTAVALFFTDVAIHTGDIGVVAIANFLAHTSRSWMYAVIGVAALVALRRRSTWLDQIDRRFFRERYNAQQILREVVEEIRQASSIVQVAERVVMRIDAALHLESVVVFMREPNETAYHALASVPVAVAPPFLPTDSKLVGLLRLLGNPLQISTEGSWLQQLPASDMEIIRRAGIDLLVPISLSAFGREALLALGSKKSEEPYGREDEALLVAIASALALLLERPAMVAAASGLEECPTCGLCYDSGAGRCADDAAPLGRSTVPRVLLGRYRLERRLGRGGMGTVYRALDTLLDRHVAVKVVREDLVASVDAAERFRREAKAAAAITHPNLVTLYDFAVDEGHRAFLVMELLSGVTLRQQLRLQHRLDVADMVAIVRGLCAALGVVHQRGLIHRDVKPENVFLVIDHGATFPKLLDFGLAKFAASAEAVTEAAGPTGVGDLVGTPRYMSPEQLEGRSVNASWDLWALAVITYEISVGMYPFGKTDTIAALQAAILGGKFAPVERRAWQALFEHTLNPVVAQRPASAIDFWTAFERAVAQP
jgi:eukaryotic-like serine/threonine-protein kinase